MEQSENKFIQGRRETRGEEKVKRMKVGARKEERVEMKCKEE